MTARSSSVWNSISTEDLFFKDRPALLPLITSRGPQLVTQPRNNHNKERRSVCALAVSADPQGMRGAFWGQFACWASDKAAGDELPNILLSLSPETLFERMQRAASGYCIGQCRQGASL